MGSVAASLARLSSLLCLSLAGCGGSAAPAVDPSPPRPDVTAPTPAPPNPDAPPPVAPSGPESDAAPEPTANAADSQVARGAELYAAECANCHGANGRGGKSPALVGLAQGALSLAPPKTAKYRKTSFKTAADVRDFMVKTMPPTAPQSLGPGDAHALLAFLLRENAVSWGSAALDASAAARLEIPPP